MSCPKCPSENKPARPAENPHPGATYTIALAGNPNSGKTSLFNALTGARQHIGNWPGKTVEKKEGEYTYRGHTFRVVDLPGTYSLSAYSAEEIVAMDYLLDEYPDVVVCVVDAANLERNLYLTVQIIEMGLPVIVALNMMDMAESRGLKIDLKRLSEGLGGVPVVPTVAVREQGLEELKARILEVAVATERVSLSGTQV
ncbi:MAG TPA: GTP-binding protein [Chloroflexi bacterium]|nr:GTP-binding protein [Chloroflexota bacterium]